MVTTSRARDEQIAEAASRLRLAIVRTARRMRQEAGGELSPTLIAALATIERHGPLTPSELAEIERVKRPTATRVATALEKEGLIERASDPTDGRASLLSASSKGRALIKRVRLRKNAYISRRLRKLGDEDVETLERAAEVLERMLEDPS
jgi:DNA-binding MarR family transcriptional regulator